MVHVLGFVAFAAATAFLVRVGYAVWMTTAALERAVGRMEATLLFSVRAPEAPAPVEAPTPTDTPVAAAPEPELAQGSRDIAIERLSRNLDEQLLRIDLGKRRTEESAVAKVARASGTIVIPPRR